ncbi:MAG: hypothetical protein AB9873_04795 [Syntrophobacteraceae bacterium]
MNAAKIAKKDYTTIDISGSNKDSNTVADCLKEIEAAGIDIAKYNTLPGTLPRAASFPVPFPAVST